MWWRWARCGLLEAIRRTGLKCRFYQASSSEMFGSTPPPQNESTPFPSPQPLRLRQGSLLTTHGELPGKLRDARFLRHSVQPRIPAARRDVRDAQDHARGGAHQARACRTSSSWATWRRAATGAMLRIMWRAMWLMLQQHEAGDYVDRHGRNAQRSRIRGAGFRPAGLDWRQS